MEQTTYAPEAAPPTVLTVGCRGKLLALCREAAALVPVEIEAGDLFTLAQVAAAVRPLALLISADVYGFDPQELDALAQTVGAGRLLVEEGERPDRLAFRLREVVLAAELGRFGEPSTPTAPPTVSGAPKRSGIRWHAVNGASPTKPAPRADEDLGAQGDDSFGELMEDDADRRVG